MHARVFKSFKYKFNGFKILCLFKVGLVNSNQRIKWKGRWFFVFVFYFCFFFAFPWSLNICEDLKSLVLVKWTRDVNSWLYTKEFISLLQAEHLKRFTLRKKTIKIIYYDILEFGSRRLPIYHHEIEKTNMHTHSTHLFNLKKI